MECTRCVECPYYDMNRQLGYYNFPYCMKNGRNIEFSYENDWDKMKWCPIENEEDESND